MGYTKTLFAYCAILLYYTPPPKKKVILFPDGCQRLSTVILPALAPSVIHEHDTRTELTVAAHFKTKHQDVPLHTER